METDVRKMEKKSNRREKEKGSSNFSNFFEKVYSYSTARIALIIFIVSILSRVILNLVFFNKYGDHAVNSLETWYYYGVAKGISGLLPLDPTTHILKFIGWIFPNGLLIYIIMAAGIILTSFTAVLIFLLAKELHDKKTGFIAGMIYGFIVVPLILNTAAFTHDHVQMPVIISTLLITVLAMKSGGHQRIILFSLLAPLIYIGANVNPLIITPVFVIILYLISAHIDNFSTRLNLNSNKMRLGLLGALLVLLILFRFVFFTEALQNVAILAQKYRNIDLLTQLTVAADLKPIAIDNLWLRYNFLWFFVPFGLIESYKRRDIISISLFLIGITLASAMSKGIRISDLGFAILIALVFINWKKQWSRYVYIFFIAFLFLAIGGLKELSIYASILYISIAFLILHLLQKKERYNGKNRGIASVLLVVAFSNLGTASYYTQPSFTETEYNMFKWLESNAQPGANILLSWEYGYAVEAISRLNPVSSPESINPEIFKVLWQEEDLALQGLEDANVKYLLISEKDFKYRVYLSPAGYQYWLYISPSTFYDRFGNGMDIDGIQKQNILIFKLLYNEEELEHFERIYKEKDEKNDINYKIFRRK